MKFKAMRGRKCYARATKPARFGSRPRLWLAVRILAVGSPLIATTNATAQLFNDYRGFMIDPRPTETEQNLRDLAEWGANLVRWQLVEDADYVSGLDPQSYLAWLDGQLDHLQDLLWICDEMGIAVVLDLHATPGGSVCVNRQNHPVGKLIRDCIGRNEYTIGRFFLPEGQVFRETFVQAWDRIARRFAGNQTIVAYDLLNEPAIRNGRGKREDRRTWQDLALSAARTIRAVPDREHVLIVEPPRAMPGELKVGQFKPLPRNLDPVVYSVHMYEPVVFTSQGLGGRRLGVGYPTGNRNKSLLERKLKPVVRFQEEHDVEIYIGEFSAVAWAPGESAFRYLRDLIDIFEDHGWSWTYHAFREYEGWSVEHVGTGPLDIWESPETTSRELLLRDAFEQNP